MNPREKNLLIAGISMGALLAFQNATKHIADEKYKDYFNGLENNPEIVVLGASYGTMMKNTQIIKNGHEDISSTQSTVVGLDRHNQAWTCVSREFQTKNETVRPMWQINNDQPRQGEKIAFPKENCQPMIETKQQKPFILPRETKPSPQII